MINPIFLQYPTRNRWRVSCLVHHVRIGLYVVIAETAYAPSGLKRLQDMPPGISARNGYGPCRTQTQPHGLHMLISQSCSSGL